MTSHTLFDFRNFIERQRLQNFSSLWVGFSGGLDSTVLLHSLTEAFPEHTIKALHVNHQLQGQSSQWERQCAELAEEWGAEFFCERVEVDVHGGSLENAARKRRLEVFANYLKSGGLLFLAHHQDDQAETFIYRLMRGAGLQGLSGMKPCRPFGEGHILRPLLDLPRSELLAYAKRNHLTWVEDASNDDDTFDRNFIRHQVLPRLSDRWPRAVEQVAWSAHLMQDAVKYLDSACRRDLQDCRPRKERLGDSIDITGFSQRELAEKNTLLRYWLSTLGEDIPSRYQLHEIIKVISAAEDASPCLKFGSKVIRRFQSRLFCLPDCRVARTNDGHEMAEAVIEIQANESLLLPDGSEFCLTCPAHIAETLPPLRIVFRRGGERCRPEARQHRQTLKRLYQEYLLEPWLRPFAPIVVGGQEILAVADLFKCVGGDGRNHLPDAASIRWYYPKNG